MRRIAMRPTALVWKWDSDAFGTTAANENPSALGAFNYNLRFPGQYYDKETANHYNYFRDNYNPKIGRYMQSDPIGLDGLIRKSGLLMIPDADRADVEQLFVNTQDPTLSLYSYANGSPVNLADPDGQRARAIIAAAIAVASKTKKFVDDLNFDGPSPGLTHGNGRICQIRYKKKPVIRLDYHPYTGTNNESRLHLNVGTGEDNHISLDPRSLRD